VIALCFLSITFFAQTKKAGPAEKSFKEELKSDKQLRIEKREKRRQERAERKAIKKYHQRIQTKQVRKRMKRNRNTAIRNHEHKREFFIKRWFQKKKRIKRFSKKTK
jgi:hypothetical protein